MQEVVVISGKGGTGKTSVTAALAALGPKKVLADCDVDAADLHLVLAPDNIRTEDFIAGERAFINADACVGCGLCLEHCRYGAVSAQFEIINENCEGCGVCAFVCPEDAAVMLPRHCGVWHIAKTRFGSLVHARLGVAEENSGKLVTTVRQAARKLAEEQGASLILTDGPPGIGCPVIASLGGADLALAVAEPTTSALHDLKRVHDLTKHFDIPLMVIINKSGINEEITKTIGDYCKDNGVEMAGTLPYDNAFTQAQIRALSVVEYDPEGRGRDLLGLWNRIQARLDQDNQ
ncbi:MAG: ATP-binding protein [Proteobacteria bacterium]|nr:ATP-binding protein [Pseudomonadota bacterium]